MHWYNALLLALLVVPIAFSLLGVGTRRLWGGYTIAAGCSFLGWAGEAWRLQHPDSEVSSAFYLAVCAFAGGLFAERIATRRQGS